METRPVEDKSQWEAYLGSRPEANFLQSWNWGVFQASLGRQVWRLGVYQDGAQIGAVSVVKENAKRGDFLAVAAGPLIDWSSQDKPAPTLAVHRVICGFGQSGLGFDENITADRIDTFHNVWFFYQGNTDEPMPEIFTRLEAENKAEQKAEQARKDAEYEKRSREQAKESHAELFAMLRPRN